MKRTIVAILAFAPAMLLAQTATPAQPSSTPVLQSALLQPALFSDLKSSGSTSPNPAPRPIFSGLVAPKLLYSSPLPVSEHAYHLVASDRVIMVEMTVNKAGVPEDIHLAEQVDPLLEQKVVASVSQFRFKPGTLDGQPASFPVRLRYTLASGSSY